MEILDNVKLSEVLGHYAPGVDAAGDGLFTLQWRSTETFYRHTEDYVAPEKRAAYKKALENAFPGKRAVF